MSQNISVLDCVESRSIDYAIAHEAVRFLRFMQSPPEERYAQISTREHRLRAFKQMDEDISGKAEQLKPFIRLGFDCFYDGILTQLVSTPGDFWINQWLYEEFPRFREELKKGVDEVFERARQSLNFRIKQLTPKIVYRASNAMNAAFALFMDDLLDLEEFSQTYEATDFWIIG